MSNVSYIGNEKYCDLLSKAKLKKTVHRPLFCRIFFLIRSLNARMESRENRTPGQDGRLDWVGVGAENNRGAVDIFGERVNSLFPPETENSH